MLDWLFILKGNTEKRDHVQPAPDHHMLLAQHEHRKAEELRLQQLQQKRFLRR